MIDVMKDKRYAHIPKKYKRGNCYKDAIAYIFANSEKNKNLRLCHGWVSGRGVTYGTRFSYAWVEDIKTKQVIAPSVAISKSLIIDRILYYAMGNIIEKRVIKYTYKKMLANLMKTAKAGPWSAKFDE